MAQASCRASPGMSDTAWPCEGFRTRCGEAARARGLGPVPIEPCPTADGCSPTWRSCSGKTSPTSRRASIRCRRITTARWRPCCAARDEVLTAETSRKRPRYYLQNFHFQSGGWLTEDSARRYDTQVEVLFQGTANATRRQALPQLHEIFAGRDQRRMRLLDVGCGTGRFLDIVKQVWPRLPAVGLDMSEAYVREAKRYLRRWARIDLVVGNGEKIPMPDDSQDAVTSIFLFHELPPKVRRTVFDEFARVLKPGGRLILVDSLQRGDEPDYEGLLELFPQSFHEPYYASYLEEDFGAIARARGLTHTRDRNAFVSKVMIFDKPAARALAAARKT